MSESESHEVNEFNIKNRTVART